MKIRHAQPMTRVEGDSELIITRKKDKDISVSFRMPTTRDFKGILIGQQFEDIPKIVPRICGICPVSHRIGAIQAIETVFEVTLSPIAEVVREIALLGEVIRSHTYSVFFSTLPDLMYLANQVSRKDILGIDKIQSRALPLAMKLFRTAESMITATAGQINLGYNLVIGGVRQNITIDQQQELIQNLHSLLPGIQWAKEYYQWLLSEVKGEIQHFTLPIPLFISCFDTTRNWFSGTNEVSLLTPEGSKTTFPSREFSTQLLEETQVDTPTSIYYKAIQSSDHLLLAGPHARLASLKSKTTKSPESPIGLPNLFFTGLLRLDEIEFSVTNAIHLLESEWHHGNQLQTLYQYQPGTGTSAIEAPRGILLYAISINENGTVKDIKIRVPTELNLLALTNLTQTVITACFEIGWTADQAMERAQMAIRCFDPCISCATHTDVKFRP